MKRKASQKKSGIVSELTRLLKPYPSGWVALTPDEKQVIASAETLAETQKQATERGYPHPIFVKILPPDRGYAGNVASQLQ